MADAADLKSAEEIHTGSSPVAATIYIFERGKSNEKEEASLLCDKRRQPIYTR